MMLLGNENICCWPAAAAMFRKLTTVEHFINGLFVVSVQKVVNTINFKFPEMICRPGTCRNSLIILTFDASSQWAPMGLNRQQLLDAMMLESWPPTEVI